MWVIIKILVVLISFVYRLFAKSSFDESDAINVEGVKLNEQTSKNKNGAITSTSFVAKLESNFIFKLTKESFFDRWMKSLGIAAEIQSGDLRFDDHIYIASDNQEFMQQLCMNQEARKLIIEQFNSGCNFIKSDGHTIEVDYSGDSTGDIELKKKFSSFCKHVFKIKLMPRAFIDTFSIKVLVLEAIVWSIATYAILGFIEFYINRDDVHLSEMGVFIQGLWVGLGLAIALIIFIIMLLRGSSRGHRVIVESMLVLGFSLPLGGYNLVSDLNRKMDESATTFVEAKIVNKYERKHRRRRSSYYTYHIQIDTPFTTDPYHVSRDLNVVKAVYDQAKPGHIITIGIGPGWLHHPWYKSFEFRPGTELDKR